MVDPAGFGTTYGFIVEGAGGSGEMVAPVSPAAPLGTGAARLTTNGSSGGILFGAAVHTGTAFSAIDALSFDTFQPATNAAPSHSASIQLGIDKDLTDAATGFQGRLVGVPIGATTGAWRTWNGLSATDMAWGYTASAGAPTCQLSATLCDWSTAIAVFPNGGIHATPGFGFVGAKSGSGTSGLNDTYVDAITVGISGNTTIYDLEDDCSTTCYVDDLTGNDANNGSSPATAKQTVQAAVDQVNPQGTVVVAAGGYVEQVLVDKEVTINGAGPGLTVIEMPASPTTNSCLGAPAFAVVTVASSGCSATAQPTWNVNLNDLTIDGTIAATSCADRMYGLAIGDSITVNATDLEVTDIRASNPGLYGCQSGLGILAGRASASTFGTFLGQRVTVTGFQKGGVVADGSGSHVELTDSLIDGGLVPAVNNTIAMNGVQIGRGASGILDNVTIQGNQCRIAYPTCSGYDATWASGVLLFQTATDPVVIRNSDLLDNDAAILVLDGATAAPPTTPPITIEDNLINGNRYIGVYVGDSNAALSGNTITDNGDVGVEIAEATDAAGQASYVDIQQNVITGHGVGIDVTDSSSSALDVATIDANVNDLSDNSTAGIRRAAGNSVLDGECNWWGSVNGPGAPGASAKVGTFDTTPFLFNDDLGNPNCGNLPLVSINGTSVAEGNTGTTSVTLQLNLTAPLAAPLTVDLSYLGLTASGGVDFDDTTPLSVVIPPNVTSHTFTVTVYGDTEVEDHEVFTVSISEPTGGFGAPAVVDATADTANVRIENDDVAAINLGDVTLAEGDAGATIATFSVSTPADLGALSVVGTVVLSDGTAQAARDDYFAEVLSFTLDASGPTTVSARIKGDVRFEANEGFAATISSLSVPGASAPVGDLAVTGTPGTVTINNDDPAPVLTVGSQTLVEDDAGSQLMSFPVSITNPADDPMTVSYVTSADSATAGVDYTSSGGTITFAPGDVVELITVPILGDITPEATERFTLTLWGAPGWVTSGNLVARGFILDDDTSAVLTVADVTVTEGNGGSANAAVTVNLSSPVKSPVDVSVATVGGSASAGSDYTTTSGTHTIATGATSVIVNVPISGDTVLEADEDLFVQVGLATPNPAVTLGDGLARLVITNDDSLALSVSGGSVTEGNAGTTPTTATISIPAAADIPVEVSWSVVGVTAAANDFNVVGSALSGTATIPAGSTQVVVDLEAVGDLVDETNETIRVGAASSTSGVTGTPSALVTINDDDATPTITIGSATTAEGDSGDRLVALALTLSGASQSTVSVTAATAAGSATAGSDFTTSSSTVSFPPHQTTATAFVTVLGDTDREPNETFTVGLSAPSGATIATASAPVTILDDDGDVIVTVADSAALENAGPVTFGVDLSSPYSQAITIGYSVSAGSATIPGDLPVASGSILIPAGSTSGSIAVPITPDTVVEPDETFTVTLSLPGAPPRVQLGDRTGKGTITNDDSATVSVSGPASVNENNTTVSYTISLDEAASVPVVVSYTTTEDTAVAPEDYGARSGTVTFSPGQKMKTVSVPVKEDQIHEGDESFSMSVGLITQLGGLSVGVADVSTTITDDDPEPTISIAGATVTEGNAGTKVLAFPVTLTGPSSDPVSTDIVLTDGTATTPADYSAITTTLTFLPGERTKMARVAIVTDTAVEPNETFTAQLTNIVGAGTGTSEAVGTILNDDSGTNPGALTVTINDASVTEGNAGTKVMRFTVSLNRAATSTVTVSYNTADGAAVAGLDYLAKSGTLTFTAGQRTKTVTITIKGDTAREPNENFSVALSNPTGGLALATKNVGNGVIVNDD